MSMKKRKASLQEFEAWAWARGSVGNPGLGGGSYLGECVSLLQCYLYYVFGIEYAPRGHAKDFVPPGFKKLPANTKLKPGDIIRYGRAYGGGYGHVGLIDDDNEYFDQNGVTARRVGERKTPFAYIEAVFRPTKKFNVKTPKPKKDERKKKHGSVTVTASALNVRSSPSIGKNIVATYKKGERFNFDSYIKKNGYTWLSYLSYSGKRRYVAQASKDGKTKYVKGGV